MTAVRPGRRDYGEIVDFPVEIVARDGVLRHYGFDESVRLYRRRIHHAAIRGDGSLEVRQEIDHCRRRIHQLRRSYFLRYGWEPDPGDPPPLESIGEIAGEAAAFLTRMLRSGGRARVRLRALRDDRGAGVWDFEVHAEGSEELLFQVRRFDGPDAELARDHFLIEARGERVHPRVTHGRPLRAVAVHHDADFGVALYGPAEVVALWAASREGMRAVEPTAWDRVVSCIRDARHAEALARCRQLLSEEPWQLRAGLAATLLALHLGDAAVAEECARITVGYYPREASVQFLLGWSRVLQRRSAVEALEIAVHTVPDGANARLLLVTQYVAAGRWSRAQRALFGRPASAVNSEDSRAEAQLQRFEPWLTVGRGLTALGVATAVLGLGVMAIVGWSGVFPVLLGAGVSTVARVALAREHRRVLSSHRFFELSNALRRWNGVLGVLDPL